MGSGKRSARRERTACSHLKVGGGLDDPDEGQEGDKREHREKEPFAGHCVSKGLGGRVDYLQLEGDRVAMMNALTARVTRFARRYLFRSFPVTGWPHDTVEIVCLNKTCGYREVHSTERMQATTPDQCLDELRTHKRCPKCRGKVDITGLDAHIADMTFAG